jgi:hypothetical protein
VLPFLANQVAEDVVMSQGVLSTSPLQMLNEFQQNMK